ncbi:hypothetical protein ANTQUA_LOCUS2327 [Anthophora quadrimaculata]
MERSGGGKGNIAFVRGLPVNSSKDIYALVVQTADTKIVLEARGRGSDLEHIRGKFNFPVASVNEAELPPARKEDGATSYTSNTFPLRVRETFPLKKKIDLQKRRHKLACT